MAIQAVLFDLDDTLLWDERSVEEAFAATCQAAASRYPELRPGDLEQAVRAAARELYESFDTFPFAKMIGINPFEGLWARFSEGDNINFRKLEALAPGYRRESWTRGLAAVGVNDPELGLELAERFPAERRARPIVYDETFAVLDALKQKYKLLLLTNGAPDLQKEKIDGVPQLAGYFDHIVISGIFGEGKPAASIFRHSTELLGIRPGEGLMVGDKLTTDILGSGGIGMRNVWINRRNLEQPAEGAIPTYTIDTLTKLQAVIDRIQ